MIKFEFNGEQSDKYNIIITRIENNDDLISRSPIVSEKNKFRARENYFGTMYDNNYTFTLVVMKTICNKSSIPTIEVTNDGILLFHRVEEPNLNDDGELYIDDSGDLFTSTDVRRINSWLTSPQLPALFKLIYDDYYIDEVEFFATITNVSVESIGKPYELRITVQCDSPYGYSSPIYYNIISSSDNIETLNINNNSDDRDSYVYPLIIITPNKDCDISITNITDDSGTLLITAQKDKTIYIDCQNLKIYDDSNNLIPFSDIGINDIENIYWPRLLYGENEFNFTGDADFTIEYREPRKVGVF